MRPLLAAVTITSLIVVAPLEAQTTRLFNFGVGGGVSFLTGEDRDFWNDGFNIQGSVIANISTLPIAVRLDVTYQGLAGKDASTGVADTLFIGDLSVLSGTLNAVYHFGSAERSTRPYLLGGLGIYRTELDAVLYGQDVSDSTTDFGITGAVGLSVSIASVSAFIEARAHNILSEGESAQIYPVTVGVVF
jgi:hypothetical protein